MAGSQGNTVLNWRPAFSAGDFRFTSDFYLTSESESLSTGWSHMDYVPTRLTITRFAGSAGRVLVNYTVTNSFYTNFVYTELEA